MKTLIKISWRNVWRNPARSVVIILAIAFGLWGGIMAVGISKGFMMQFFSLSIEKEVSHIQAHHPDYLLDKNPKYRIESTNELHHFLMSNPNVKAFSMRIITNGMLGNSTINRNVNIVGINPSWENNTTGLSKNILEGNYLSLKSDKEVMISKKTAEKMNAKVNSKMTLSFQNSHGELETNTFTVCGIYRTANAQLDETKVFVNSNVLSAPSNDSLYANEIAILMNDLSLVSPFVDLLKKEFPQTTFRYWGEIAPDLAFTSEMSDVTMWALIGIILFALAFGLLNTMLMSVFERTREIGVLMAVGMNKRKIFGMIMFETIFIIVSGSLIGMILGFVGINGLSKTGIDFSKMGGDSLANYGMESTVYPSIEASFYVYLLIIVVITAIVSSLYPARKALKMNPSEAVSKI